MPPSVPPPMPPSIPEKYNVSPAAFGSTLSASAPMSSIQVINLARERMTAALRDNESQAAEASTVSNDLKPGVTIDLSRLNIQNLPDEVVDIIKNELERLALSHNKLTSFPVRFSECTSLRYLNVRNNRIERFPLALCELKSLEILDLGRNKIRTLPNEIAKLTSLKVLAVQRNLIEELPLCLADIGSLHVLKLDGNNILFPPREAFHVQTNSPPNEGFFKEREVVEVTVTLQIKKFLRQYAQILNERENNIENGGDDLGENVETPRMPIKRVTSGRFPIRVNGNDVVDVRSPAVARAPPIPSRSHARGLSQQNTAIRRPGVMPLTIGTPNERVRSNSETVLQAGRSERPSERNRRMGIMSRKPSELGTLDEGQANNRFSHYRGLSHGSSMTGNLNSNASTASPGSPAGAEPLLQRPNYVRRLSVLPEQRRESKSFDPILESAKGILYAIFQIHPMIQLFTRLTNDGTAKRSSLEIVFYNTNVHVEELEQEIQKHEVALDGRSYGPRENENVQRAVVTLINAYSHICALLVGNMDTIVGNGDPRYIRTMMLLLYNSIMELRVSAYEVSRGGTGYVPNQSARWPGLDNTIKPHSRESSVTPTAGRPGPALATRPRVGTFVHNPSNLRVATDAALPYFHGNNRTAQIMAATPRSGESFASSSTDPKYPGDFPAEERQFEKIFLSLQKSTELVMRILPGLKIQFSNAKRSAEIQRFPDTVINAWKALITKCEISIKETEILKSRLSKIKLKEPGIRTDAIFWSLCKSFIDAWAEFGNKLKQTMEQVNLPVEIKGRLRPIQTSIKETNSLIFTSPWGNIFRQAGHFSGALSRYSPSHYSSGSTSTQVQLPMTPQSAALGPAVQATVPSTPQSGSFANVFSGNVFERADALISMGGLNMSRTNTMNSASTVSLNSISSITSMGDDRLGSSMLSPTSTTNTATYRLNGGNKPAF
ncbi:putative RAM signaling pathway protein [Rosellinia necatrix]|uniref:Putative RAM signaling pathway protein n=1 Tax=Rosellinia necatrix TaxID=77044 RepID=A0A1S7UKA7_ROSNE|nr:putative RAM signaling pathway protein [Rosellinia necatrix]